MIHEPLAAAIGIGINIERPVGSMIVDMEEELQKLQLLHYQELLQINQ